eukprot:CAMPEP_0115267332 /NCGR_PEP_ID=MMETSP0270-20121206/51935_1 /TAXON_ID=71861 /ORGANISM="Scrippsiella trochoidea, Strain CCMP3099" /LENGTH=59 /DNA_ID=CAMNT_0002683469 /DNA_START=346 /DNA_END=521 /DNA_ORIENTATION=-
MRRWPCETWPRAPNGEEGGGTTSAEALALLAVAGVFTFAVRVPGCAAIASPDGARRSRA